MTNSRLKHVLALAATLAAGCTAGVEADDGTSTAPPPKADEPVAPARHPAADDAMRALVEEVARLRAQLSDLRTAQNAAQQPSGPPAAPEQPVAEQPAADADAGAGAPPAPTVIERETLVERDVPVYVDRDVPVYVDRDVPVYVDRDVIVESAPTLIVQQVGCDEPCPPVRRFRRDEHDHDSRSDVALSITYVNQDDDHDDGRHHDSHGGGDDDRSDRHDAGGGRRAGADAPRPPRNEHPVVTPPRAPRPTERGGTEPLAHDPPPAPRAPHRGDDDARPVRAPREPVAAPVAPPATDVTPPAEPRREQPPRRTELPQRPAEQRHEPDSRTARAPDPPPPPPPPPAKHPAKPHKG